MVNEIVLNPKISGSQEVTPAGKLLEMISSTWVSQSIYAVAQLGIADLLKNSPQNVDTLAQATNVNPNSLYRLMRALASVGIFIEMPDRSFQLTPIGECLQIEHPNSLRALSILWGEEQFQAWADILYSIKTGKCAFEFQNNVSFFNYLEHNAKAARSFDEAMTAYSRHTHLSVADAYDFSGFKKIVDVGGGHGAMISSILTEYPHLKGILFDSPHAIQGATKLIKSAGVSQRCELIAGDFFESVPSGGDIYTLSSIIHDWDDDSSLAILKNCHDVMKENSKLLVIEMVILPGNEPFFGKFLDLHMLVMHGGHDRTQAEYQTLLAKAGFKLTKIITTKSLRSIIEAIPV